MTGTIHVAWKEKGGQTKQFTYIFKAVSVVKSKASQSVNRIPFINRPDDFLFRFAGKSHQLSVSFSIYDDGTDSAGGTYTKQIVSIPDQIDYLNDIIFSPRFDAEFFLFTPRYKRTGYKGVITDISINSNQESVNMVIGEMTFIVGTVAGILGLLDDLIDSLTGVDNN